jgi:hypothetical protein
MRVPQSPFSRKMLEFHNAPSAGQKTLPRFVPEALAVISRFADISAQDLLFNHCLNNRFSSCFCFPSNLNQELRERHFSLPECRRH